MMRNLYFEIVTLFFLLLSFTVQSKDICSKKTQTSEVDSCYSKVKNESEVNLNSAYFELKNRILKSYSTDEKMSKEYSGKLLAAQRNWLKYRNEQCAMEALFADIGSAANATLANQCISRINEQRIEEMKSLPH